MNLRSTLTMGVALLSLGTLGCEQSPVNVGEGDTALEGHLAHAASPRAAGAALEGSALAAIRQATAHYQQIDRAIDDGFVPLSDCVAAPWGGMGFHYGHPGRIGDPAVDPSEPEILLYEPMGNGRMRLVGVEFMVHGEAWHATNAGAPAIAGQSFDPPDPNHPDEHLRPFYTLHVWAWRNNPDGMFTPFNPQVRCQT